MIFRRRGWQMSPATLARSSAFAVILMLAFAASAFASFTISASGGWNTSTGKPDSCDSTEWLFVINGISGGPAPSSINVTFNDGSSNVQRNFLNKPGSTAHYSFLIDATNVNWVVAGATAVLQDGTTYNNFVLSHGSCGSGPPPPPPPPPGGTPELDTLLLLVGGAVPVGVALLRRRRSN